MTEDELKAQMDQVTTQVQKIGGETDSLKAQIDVLNQRVTDLETALASEQVKPETEAAFNALKEQVNVVDAKVDDIVALTSKT